MSTTPAELKDLIFRARNAGAQIRVYTGPAEVITKIQVYGGAAGIGPQPMPPIAAAECLRGFLAELPQAKHLPPREYLRCGCCAGETIGRQWHNQDRGFGLCDFCAGQLQHTQTPEQLETNFGHRGHHWDVAGRAPQIVQTPSAYYAEHVAHILGRFGVSRENPAGGIGSYQPNDEQPYRLQFADNCGADFDTAAEAFRSARVYVETALSDEQFERRAQ